FRQINPNLFFELKKYFPEAWSILDSHRKGFVAHQVSGNIQRGIEMGLYRKNFNPQLIALLYTGIIDLILDEDLFPKTVFTFKELQQEIILYHLHGICTPEGIQYLNEKTTHHE
ncbi:MAG: hypothetical protein LPK45_07915, partial [Bacteroidota bacterium]|nr:hypothetical protein [Bacteroidota bacterium]MDX5430996.1 hypothetical protein [Bacteroidota bacterium]MDX5469747.1 hypothetical protein [Bacteroidota bacterium]